MKVETRLGKRWAVAPRDPQAEEALSRELGLHPLVAAVLASRGHSDPRQAERFLDPSLEQLHDPRLLPDFEPAVRAVLGARERKETIYVHGDYDVDGVSSAALFTRFLTRIGCTVVPHVPHRTREGYGIHLDAVGWAREHGASLFLTCDCGISAHEQVRAANEAGMTVVVTDHHQVGSSLPEAAAVVNPHRHDSPYPWRELSGAGVAFKLGQGIARELGLPEEKYFRAYLDLAVLGTVADIMPLLDENRVITHHGLAHLRHTRKTGLQALMEVSDLSDPKKALTAYHIGFQLGPRLNAVGRIDDASTALDLLLTEEPAEARRLARELDDANTRRKAAEKRAIEEAVARVEAEGLGDRLTILVADPDWHPGLIGLVAGRLVERFRRPTFVVSIDGDSAKGSARSISGFHLKEALDAVRPLLLSGGGHELAAGFSLEAGRLDDLRTALESHAVSVISPDDLVPRLTIDAEVSSAEAGPSAASALHSLEPFGNGNPDPVLCVRGVNLSSVVPTRNPEHAQVTLETNDGPRRGMAFGIGQDLASLEPGARVDVAFRIEANEFNGKTTARWIVVDVQESES
ncbi:MAG: single-stranded-DNA-specific exonuclease RecJ [Fimbriimonadaceae bacterium]|nr:single-stranded-DNA-specific exonuclease RecJ [Fimbriimonadaceae bacterium]QYK57310.1 MAG: single-stranded-DNA-specific exonuclease RecJ [Fimbriimonadaceae bacterium]